MRLNGPVKITCPTAGRGQHIPLRTIALHHLRRHQTRRFFGMSHRPGMVAPAARQHRTHHRQLRSDHIPLRAGQGAIIHQPPVRLVGLFQLRLNSRILPAEEQCPAAGQGHRWILALHSRRQPIQPTLHRGHLAPVQQWFPMFEDQ